MSDRTPSPRMTCLTTVEDPRISRAKLHERQDIRVLGVRATIGGADHRVAREDFGKAHQAWRGTFLALPHRIPSHDTLGRVWARRDATPLETCFRDGVQAAFTLTQGPRVAMDGQRVRGSRDVHQDQPPLHLVRAWSQAHHLVLAPQAVDHRTHEITVMPQWRQMRDRAGGIVTRDRVLPGWGGPTRIAPQIRDPEADYVRAVKGHPQALPARLQDPFAYAQTPGFVDGPHDDVETVPKDHGRVETRRGGAIGGPAPAGTWTPSR